MNKLDELFKTKAKIEAELRAENEARLKDLENARREKALADASIAQKRTDEAQYNLVKEMVDKYRPTIGDRINDPEYMLYFYSLLFLAAERHFNPVIDYVNGMTREYDMNHK